MSYRYLEDVTIADVAFEAEGTTVEEMFQAAAAAMTNVMITDLATIGGEATKSLIIEAPAIDMLLYRFLQELIFYKDAELLLFSRFDLEIRQDTSGWHLRGLAYGEEIDAKNHELLADVKAVSFHDFSVSHDDSCWKAKVIIDV